MYGSRLAAGVVAATAASVAIWIAAGTQTGDRADSLRPQRSTPQSVTKEGARAVPGQGDRHAATIDYHAPRDRDLKVTDSDTSVPAEAQMPRMALQSATQPSANAEQTLPAAATAPASSPDSSQATDDPDETEEKRIITIDNVDSVFKASPCDRPSECKITRDLARRILGELKRESDSWAYGMEFEMRNALKELLAADSTARGKDVVYQVTCNVHGCLIYREDPVSPTFAYELRKNIRGNGEIAELNDNGQWPNAGSFFWGNFHPDKSFEVIVFQR